MDPADTIVLPSLAAPSPRAQPPLLAAIVPVVAGVVLFAVTGNALSLCFAAIGPVMILASFLDGVRQRRRAVRIARAEEAEAWVRVRQVVTERSDAERTRRWHAAPDLGGCLIDPPLRHAALDRDAELTVGSGEGPSPLRFSGAGERAEAFRAQHRALAEVPVTASWESGVCVRGPAPVAAAVARAMVLQLCLRHATGAIRLEGDGLAGLGLAELPQSRRRGSDAAVVHVGELRTVATGPRIALLAPGAPPPPGYAAVLDVTDPSAAELRTQVGVQACAVQGISAEQTDALVRALTDDAGAEAEMPAAVTLADALGAALGNVVGAEPGRAGAGDGLAVAIGRDAVGPVVVDLVSEGPHALVTGVTGAGKSELLVSWVAALAAVHTAQRVSFVLADFKGGTAFEPLRALPHVAAVITDLDLGGAERGVRSLRAELRRREGILAAHGARNIAEAGDTLGRLVIVIDEFAALLQEHADLGAVFTDIAARGRALGMHLILGTQRATGVIRDALSTNCPLRIALRVTDPADSRAMIGTDQAAALPGDAGGRGLALVRRPQDPAPAVFRVARTTPGELGALVERVRGQERARSPWLPALPLRLSRTRLTAPQDGEIVLGVADEPEQQRQTLRTLRPTQDRGLMVFGGPVSGKSTVLQALAEQVPQVLWIPQDPEQAWTLIDEIAEGRRPMPPLLVVDDVDRHFAAFPLEYAAAWAERLQRVVRAAGERGGTVVLSASRCSGQIAAIAELLPLRALLRTASRAEHLAAGGESAAFDPERPPGRAVLGTTEVQCALPDSDEGAPDPLPDLTPQWKPRAALVAVVSATPARTVETLATRFGAAAVRLVGDGGGTGDVGLGDAAAGRAGEPGLLLLVGDADAWQRQYALWQRVARTGEVLVLAEAARELRTLAGVREIPPYATPYAGRAWTISADGRPSRVILQAPAPRAPLSRATRRAR